MADGWLDGWTGISGSGAGARQESQALRRPPPPRSRYSHEPAASPKRADGLFDHHQLAARSGGANEDTRKEAHAGSRVRTADQISKGPRGASRKDPLKPPSDTDASTRPVASARYRRGKNRRQAARHTHQMAGSPTALAYQRGA